MTRMPYRGGGMPGRGGMQPGAQISGGPMQRAALALQNGQPAATVEITRRELEKKPNDANMRLLLAQALTQMNRGRDGATEARRVLEAQKNNVDAMLVLSQALISTNQMNPPKEALAVLDRAAELQPKNARVQVQRAQTLMLMRQFDQARDAADEAVRLDQRLGAAYLVKGMAAMQLKDYQGGEDAFKAALRQDRTLAQAYLGLAQAQSELRRPEEALESVVQAQKLNPNLPENQVLQLRAQIYRKQRKYGQAYQEYLLATRRSGNTNNRFAPLIAAVTFFLSFFGQAGPFVLILLILAILFGIAKIPVVGGVLIDAVLVLIFGFGGWNLLRQFTGQSPMLRLARQPLGALAVAALVGGFLLIFGIFAFVTHSQAPSHWFTTASFGLGAAAGLISAIVILYFGGGTSRA